MRRATIIFTLWAAIAQADPLRWGSAGIYSHGETFAMAYVIPAMHKWYCPRYLP